MSCDYITGRPAASQGTTLTWGGDNIGMLTSLTVRAGRAGLVDITSAASAVLGTGWNSRVVREVNCGAIEPAAISVSCYSSGFSFSSNDRGDTRFLVLIGEWGSYTGNAILQDYSIDGKLGKFVTMKIEFTFTGA